MRSAPSLHFDAIATAGAAKPWLTRVHGASQLSGLFSAQADGFRTDYRLLLIDLPATAALQTSPASISPTRERPQEFWEFPAEVDARARQFLARCATIAT